MKTVELIETADANRQIHLTIPVDEASTRYRLTVSIEPEVALKSESFEPTGRLVDEWPPGFIERTFGGWKGELERAPQGDFEERTPF